MKFKNGKEDMIQFKDIEPGDVFLCPLVDGTELPLIKTSPDITYYHGDEVNAISLDCGGPYSFKDTELVTKPDSVLMLNGR